MAGPILFTREEAARRLKISVRFLDDFRKRVGA